jgi:putative oxidoreductase
MNYAKRLELWGDRHHPVWIDFVRIALGVFLFIKGIEFARNTESLTSLISNQEAFGTFPSVLVTHFIIFAHIFGGFLIATGLLTRIACLVNIPILLGALLFVNWNAMNHWSILPLSLITLLLLVYFLVVGSGPLSLNRVLFRHNGQIE